MFTACLLPIIVTASDRFLSHWTKSAENHAIMIKTFSFLVLMIIILPSVGLIRFVVLFLSLLILSAGFPPIYFFNCLCIFEISVI